MLLLWLAVVGRNSLVIRRSVQRLSALEVGL